MANLFEAESKNATRIAKVLENAKGRKDQYQALVDLDIPQRVLLQIIKDYGEDKFYKPHEMLFLVIDQYEATQDDWD